MKIRELYTDKSKWTQGAFARDAAGESTRDLGKAVSFCLLEAINYCYSPLERPWIYGRLWNRFGYCQILAWNDARGRTFEEVKAFVEELDI